jgi:hypothetical protein
VSGPITPPRAALFVDGIAVLLHLLRTGLPPMRDDLSEVYVCEDVPERLAEKLPVVRIARTGGASDNPRFVSQFWCNVQVWSDREALSPTETWDPHKAAYELSQQVAQVLYRAWDEQVLTPYGSINKWRESTGFRKFTDPGLPHYGRYVATYDLMIRNPRP